MLRNFRFITGQSADSRRRERLSAKANAGVGRGGDPHRAAECVDDPRERSADVPVKIQ